MGFEKEKPETVAEAPITSDGIIKMRNPARLRCLLPGLLVAGLVILTFALNISRAVRADYSHDEDQFIASARLLLDEGLFPYRDYPYFHTPYLVFVYAGLFAITGSYNLLAARLLSAVCASAAVLLLFWLVLDLYRGHPGKIRYTVAASILLLYLPNPLLSATAGFSWNHNLAVLLMIGSLCVVLISMQKRTPGLWWLGGGVLLGLAVGVRLTSLTLLPAFLLALFWLPRDFPRSRCFRLGLSFLAGFTLGLLPLAWFMVIAPRQLIFGNLGYAGLNSAYRLNIPVAFDGLTPIYGAMTLGEKLGYLWKDVIAQPANLIVLISLIFFGLSVLSLQLGRKQGHAFRNILLLSTVPFTAIGSFLPSPSWYQYFYAPLPFALLTVALGFSYLVQSLGQSSKWFTLLLIQLVLLTNLIMFQEYRRMSFLLHVDLWKPMVIHQVGLELREILGPDAMVFTLAPLYPLEGDLKIYEPLATGVFAYRTGSLLDQEQRDGYGIIATENVEPTLAASLPQGILVGFDTQLEEQIIEVAVSRDYVAHPLSEVLTLWINPNLALP